MARAPHRLATLGLALAALGATGCYAGDDDSYYDSGYCDNGIQDASIDTNRILVLDPGRVGATAEYFGDGAWRFAAACDTELSGANCNWHLAVTALEGSIDSFAPESLESDDILDWDGPAERSVVFDVLTDYDIDAFTLEATPGATLEVSVTLDGGCGGPFFFWLEQGETPGAFTQVVDLTPG